MVRYFPSHTSRLLLQILCFLMSDFSLPLLSPPSAIPLCLSSPISDLHPSVPAFFPSLGHLFSPHPIFSSGRSPSFPSLPFPYHQPSLSTLSSPAAGLFPFLFQPFPPHPPGTILSAVGSSASESSSPIDVISTVGRNERSE